MSIKLGAGVYIENVEATLMSGESVFVNKPLVEGNWVALFIYRGNHCPLCLNFLSELEEYKSKLNDLNIEVIAVSGDNVNQASETISHINITYPIAYGLREDQMKKLGLYISVPRSSSETDHNFSEPGMLIINEYGQLHLIDISNSPFSRPNIEILVNGLEWIKNPSNNYPIRGGLPY